MKCIECGKEMPCRISSTNPNVHIYTIINETLCSPECSRIFWSAHRYKSVSEILEEQKRSKAVKK